ncbi:MAG: hypothetical protein HY351_05520 [Candidatus Omnitrophica bacterium]|nr:hypothetical protein [Candidatus Omnitrophota bacterium]
MDKEHLSPELEQLIRKVRLKEPPEGLMADYLAGVNAKIDRGASGSHFGFPQVAMVLAVGLALAGAAYFYWVRPQTQSAPDVETTTFVVSETSVQPNNEATVLDNTEQPLSSEIPSTPVQKSLSIEEEMAVLEAFGEELDEEGIDLLGDDEVFEELGQLDEIELSPGFSTQP